MLTDLTYKLEELERKFETHDKQIISIFEAIRQLMLPPEKPKRKIACPPPNMVYFNRRGFRVEEPKTNYRILRRST